MKNGESCSFYYVQKSIYKLNCYKKNKGTFPYFFLRLYLYVNIATTTKNLTDK